MKIPTPKDIQTAHERIKPFVHETPVLKSTLLNQMLDCDIFFKCENFQKAGAFKYRGATNAILQLSLEEKQKGVATHSSGNHAGALAKAAQMNGIDAHIVMPTSSPNVKKEAVNSYGAEVTYCESTLVARENTVNEIIEKTGALLIHPYDNFNIICGQGTATLELLTAKPDLDIVMAPVGGGGLLSGTCIAAKGVKPNIKIYGAEPLNANDAIRSLRSGKLQPSINPKTIADGLLTSLSDLTFEIIKTNVTDIITATETSIIKAMKLIWERLKIIIEPSSAVPLACVLENPTIFENKQIGIIISGGNVDLNHLPF